VAAHDAIRPSRRCGSAAATAAEAPGRTVRFHVIQELQVDRLCLALSALDGTDNQVKGTENQVPGTDNQVKGTDNQVKGTDNQVPSTDNGVERTDNEVKGCR
jgi:hypothetical protein